MILVAGTIITFALAMVFLIFAIYAIASSDEKR